MLFISYSHDSQEHQDRVRALADHLRADGIDAKIDQYAPTPLEGWPMWMEMQIRTAQFVLLVCTETYLRRVELREEPGKGRGVLWEAKLIYNSLYPEDTDVQKFIPILFADAHLSSIPLPLRGLTHYRVDTKEGYDDLYRQLTNQPRFEVPAVGKLKSLPTIAPQSYPASLAEKPAAKLPTSLDQRHRQQLIKQVRLDWIDGVLNQSLYKIARLELGLASRSELLEQPLNAVLQIPDRARVAILPGTPISRIFDEQTGAVLILGGPGTGKTTLLLELAQDLLLRAEQDENHPMPVVFNLSSWAVRRRPLIEWLIAELNERSNVSRKIARQWLEDEQILPLLDGLDEVAEPHREACVEAVNNFRREHGLLPMAVCSRIADYEALGTKLRLRNAVQVQPLTGHQVEDYLNRVGEPLRRLRSAMENDRYFCELLETPLMLWVAMLAYRDSPPISTPGASLDQQRRQLFSHFVEAMFRRRGREWRYNQKQTTHWLCSLACTLTRNNQTVLYLETIDFNWLPTWTQQWLARAGVFLITGLVFGVIGWLIGGLMTGSFWLVLALMVGFSGAFLKTQPVEKAGLRWRNVSSRKKEALNAGVRVWLVVGLIFGLGMSMTVWLMGRQVLALMATAVESGSVSGLIDSQGLMRLRDLMAGESARLWLALKVGVMGGATFGLIFGLIGGLIRLFTSEAIAETRSVANQGTHRSVKMALIFGLTAWASVGLIEGPITGLMPKWIEWLTGGLVFGLLVGLFSGGMFAVKHFVLRLFVWRNGSAPLRYVAFLGHAKEMLFLNQVGGGYKFAHRLLQEYFVSLGQSKKTSQQP